MAPVIIEEKEYYREKANISSRGLISSKAPRFLIILIITVIKRDGVIE